MQVIGCPKRIGQTVFWFCDTILVPGCVFNQSSLLKCRYLSYWLRVLFGYANEPQTAGSLRCCYWCLAAIKQSHIVGSFRAKTNTYTKGKYRLKIVPDVIKINANLRLIFICVGAKNRIIALAPLTPTPRSIKSMCRYCPFNETLFSECG